ncbi:hypothetical protein C1H46_044302 [Malus baccata]|uniref:Uncharacterized protein n=1 Tax=Malus baccata TaxID=106549 RepID=A0A540K8C7_MALBA|nr:hypothetical protein C1H46_044302 [Malus baccata]
MTTGIGLPYAMEVLEGDAGRGEDEGVHTVVDELQFQRHERRYVGKKVKAKMSNHEKKTLLHYSGSKPFLYMMEAQRQVITKGLCSTRDELAESLHRQLVLQEFASQLPPETPLESVDPPEDEGFQILIETLIRLSGGGR